MPAQPAAHVLVVDDEPDLADLYRRWLAPPHEVTVVNEGSSALSALDPAVDVVLLDRRMPGLSGDEVLDEIRARGLDCRVAMVTAVTPDEDVLELGFDDYLVKPVAEEDLRGAVRRLLRRSDHSAAVRELYALASKKAALEVAGSDAATTTEALEARIRERARALEASGAQLEPADFEALFYDLREELSTDPAS